MREPLLFTGIRWPGSKVVARGQFIGSNFAEKKVPLTDALIVETSGNGRPYSVASAEAWWRDFVDFSIDDERRVLSFLARRGDPFGLLAPDGKQISTHQWLGLKAVLGQAAAAWTSRPGYFEGLSPPLSPPGYLEGLSPLSRFHPEMLEVAGRFLLDFGTEWTSQLSVVYVGLRPVLSTKLLAAYMCAAAAASLRAGLDMRRCGYCSSWFTLHYANARHCSASCRAAQFNQRRSPHGFLPQDLDSQGSDSVAESMASAGDERPPAGPVAELRNPEGSSSARRADARDRKPRRR
jgi:hypothetical protein